MKFNYKKNIVRKFSIQEWKIIASPKKKITEKETRIFIDKQLTKEGWLKRYIKDEVNSVRSNFKEKEYILSEGEGDKSGRFIDYLLLAEDNSPLAFIEAKRFSASEDKGRAQSRTYLEDIKKQTGMKLDPRPQMNLDDYRELSKQADEAGIFRFVLIIPLSV